MRLPDQARDLLRFHGGPVLLETLAARIEELEAALRAISLAHSTKVFRNSDRAIWKKYVEPEIYAANRLLRSEQ